jgi:3-phosphoshikimate 1-carboxyvinyltransferase
MWWSNPTCPTAAQFLAAALVTGGRVHVPGWPQWTTQGGDAMRDILDIMGADVHLDRTGLTVTGTGSINGLDIDLHGSSELTPVVAALCALADGPSIIRGVAHIRGHETDRIAALARELNGLGSDVTETEDGLRITPARCAAAVSTRMPITAWSWPVRSSGSPCRASLVENPATVAKTLPTFTRLWVRHARRQRHR